VGGFFRRRGAPPAARADAVAGVGGES
jgi:hypothetical protein